MSTYSNAVAMVYPSADSSIVEATTEPDKHQMNVL